VKSRVAPLGKVILIALSSVPSICAALKPVGIEPRVEQRRRFDLLGLAMGGGLVEHGAQRGEELDENRCGDLVHRDGHDVILQVLHGRTLSPRSQPYDIVWESRQGRQTIATKA
jgi:hypothetical protein